MGEQYDAAVSLHEICKGIKQCKQGVSHKDGPMDWYIHSYTKGKALKDELTSGKYKLRPGTVVKIYRPKKREAIAPWFKDRAWQRSMCNNGVYDDLTRSLTYDNAACQKGKGTDQSIRRTIQFLQKIYRDGWNNDGWGVHIDVKKYFPSTPHDEIRALDRRVISDACFLPYLDEIISSVADARPHDIIAADPFGERGTGLGSQINQLHQVALLNDIDHELKCFCKYSERYMDDFLALDKRKDVCVRAAETVNEMLKTRGLQSVCKAGVFRVSDGFYFLRHYFKLTDTGKIVVRLHPETMRNERNALRGLKNAVARGDVTMEYVRQHYQCFIAQAEYSSGDGAIRAMDKFYTGLFREKPIYKRKRRYFYGNYQGCKNGAARRTQDAGGAAGAAGKIECES